MCYLSCRFVAEFMFFLLAHIHVKVYYLVIPSVYGAGCVYVSVQRCFICNSCGVGTVS
jgi:hypothetical protein